MRKVDGHRLMYQFRALPKQMNVILEGTCEGNSKLKEALTNLNNQDWPFLSINIKPYTIPYIPPLSKGAPALAQMLRSFQAEVPQQGPTTHIPEIQQKVVHVTPDGLVTGFNFGATGTTQAPTSHTTLVQINGLNDVTEPTVVLNGENMLIFSGSSTLMQKINQDVVVTTTQLQDSIPSPAVSKQNQTCSQRVETIDTKISCVENNPCSEPTCTPDSAFQNYAITRQNSDESVFVDDRGNKRVQTSAIWVCFSC